MSRMVVYELDNTATASIPQITFDRGWAINAAAETRVAVIEDNLVDALQFGRMVTVEHPRLPAWAGVIDPPWGALLPVSMTVFDAPYLLSRRSPERPGRIHGTTRSIALEMVQMAQDQEWMGIVPGEIDADDTERDEVYDQRNFWDQMLDLVKKAGLEMRLRPVRDGQNRLQLLLDIKPRLGADTGYLLHDGEGGNLEITSAEVQGPIWNRVYASGNQSTRASRLRGDGVNDEASQEKYRTRSTYQQFAGVSEQSVLQQKAATYLQQYSGPRLVIKANVVENDMHPDTFRYLDAGNSAIFHSSRVRLPGGVKGWTGTARIEVMSFIEAKQRVTITITGAI